MGRILHYLLLEPKLVSSYVRVNLASSCWWQNRDLRLLRGNKEQNVPATCRTCTEHPTDGKCHWLVWKYRGLVTKCFLRSKLYRLTCKGAEALLGDIKKQPGHGPGQLGLGGPAGGLDQGTFRVPYQPQPFCGTCQCSLEQFMCPPPSLTPAKLILVNFGTKPLRTAPLKGQGLRQTK